MARADGFTGTDNEQPKSTMKVSMRRGSMRCALVDNLASQGVDHLILSAAASKTAEMMHDSVAFVRLSSLPLAPRADMNARILREFPKMREPKNIPQIAGFPYSQDPKKAPP